MELHCREREDLLSESPVKSRPVRAFGDAVLTRGDRVRRNLMILERSCSKQRAVTVQSRTRRILTGWMLQVCEEQMCEQEVFPLAVHYMDSYISHNAVHSGALQLLGCGCMFLASKLRDSIPLSATKLCVYTDHAVTIPEILQWEVLLASSLYWDLAAVLPSDFLELLLPALPVPSQTHGSIRRHTHCYIALGATGAQTTTTHRRSATVASQTPAGFSGLRTVVFFIRQGSKEAVEVQFSCFLPSVLCMACVSCAVLRLKLLQTDTKSSEGVLQVLRDELDADMVSLRKCFSLLQDTIERTFPEGER
ncbi:hypothetical protein DNTS_029344 [Danionella cerebrum]|uniref:Cyclin-like domain-containing protein n=1 Tax=Danionella cerebrum TaxID=2873325 RepID=A0A553Q7U2_9TELE|nr:hypothetical protein DNTS_029344 [Danionella translucida]